MVKEFVSKYGLSKEEPPTYTAAGDVVDYDKVKLTLKEGKLTINKYTTETCGFSETGLVDIFINSMEGIIALSKVEDSEEGYLLKVDKKKIGSVILKTLMIKVGVTSADKVRADVIECGDGYLVFGVVPVQQKHRTAPFGEVGDTMGLHKEIGEKLEGSDF